MSTNQNDFAFDLEEAKKCVDVYSTSTGVQCILINANGETLSRSCSGEICTFCRSHLSSPDNSSICEKAHLYGSYQAERFGGKYVFFCPLGLVHWASPIISNGMMRAAILGGPVQMVNPDDFLLDDIIKNSFGDESILKQLRRHIEKVPVIKPEIVNNMSELLFIVSGHLSDVSPTKYQEERELQEQQADISGYLHYIKTMGGGDDSSAQSYPLDKEKELTALISIGDKHGAQKVLNEIFGHIFFASGGNFEVIKARVLELIVVLSRAALEGGADVEQISRWQ